MPSRTSVWLGKVGPLDAGAGVRSSLTLPMREWSPFIPPFAALHLTLETTSPLRLTNLLPIHLRSGLGAALRAQECRTARPDCVGCPEAARCHYSLLFESPANGAEAGGRVYSHVPHPFVLEAPFSVPGHSPAGMRYELRLALLGPAIANAGRLLGALANLGASGRCGGYFQMAAQPATAPEARIYDFMERTLEMTPPLWGPEQYGAAPSALRLRFDSPLSLKSPEGFLERPDFQDFWRALVRRLSVLSAAWGISPAAPERFRELLEVGRAFETLSAEFERFPASRYSARREARLPLHGVRGELIAAGPVERVLPYLWAGQWLHVGSNTSQGYGGYGVDVAFG
jgi:hypothetical protein